MPELLSADFYRIKKDFILLVALILAVAFALMTPVLYSLIGLAAGESFSELEEMGMSFSLTGKSVFVSSLSITNNFGLILPVLIGIIVCRDFSAGTVKNKIISGHTKPAVYMSHFISSVAVGTLMFIVYSLLSLALGCLILGYGEPFDTGELLFILKTLLVGLFVFASINSLAVFFAATTRSTGFTIVLQISAALLVATLGTLPLMIPALPDWFENLMRANPAYQINAIAGGIVENDILVISLVSSLAYIALVTVAGMLLFSKADQK